MLASKYLVCPNSENEWLKIASEFEKKWQFNHCLGGIGAIVLIYFLTIYLMYFIMKNARKYSILIGSFFCSN